MARKPNWQLRAIQAVESGDAKIVARYLREVVLEQHLSRAPLRVQTFVDILSRKLDPDCRGEALKLVFKRRPGNQSDATDLAIRNYDIVDACDALYRKCLAAGEAKRGLPKKVAREVGKSFKLGGDAVENIWQHAKRVRKAQPVQDPAYGNALAKARSRSALA
jgi:hypothetical protein